MKRIVSAAFVLAAFVIPALAQQPTGPAITGIAFARFETTDAEASQRFYGTTLGLQRVRSGADSIYAVNPMQWIEIQLTAKPVQANIRLLSVGFTTRDVAALRRYLVSKGIHMEAPTANGRLAVRDPEGNLVVFVQTASETSVASAKPSPAVTSARIIHVGFVVHDRDKESAFWQGILGFKPYWHGGRAENTTDWVTLQVPNGTDWLEFMLNPPADLTLKQAGVMNHFSLGTAHMADVVAALARNGCDGPNCSKTQLGLDGKVQLNLFDPDQTRVEFMEFAPSHEPCCSPFTGPQPTAEENR